MTPTTIKASAKLNAGQKLKARKSTTSPRVRRSRRLLIAPLKTRATTALARDERRLISVRMTWMIRTTRRIVTKRIICWLNLMPKAIPGLKDFSRAKKSPRSEIGLSRYVTARNFVS